MKKNGYAETTIKAAGKRLRSLQRNCNLKEASQLIENGFEYMTEMDGTKLFRKRK